MQDEPMSGPECGTYPASYLDPGTNWYICTG